MHFIQKYFFFVFNLILDLCSLFKMHTGHDISEIGYFFFGKKQYFYFRIAIVLLLLLLLLYQ